LWRSAFLLTVCVALWDPRAGLGCGVALLAAAAYDAWWIDRRVTALNKHIRREVFLAGEAPPPGYAGRVITAPGGRPPSFAEQERLLRELTRKRDGGAPPATPGAR
jgi:hypothetical protein